MKFLASILLVLPALVSASALNGLPDASTGAADGASDEAADISSTGAPLTWPGCDCRGVPVPPPGTPRNATAPFVASYDRLGGSKTPAEFLRLWTGPDGSYKYPPQNGFQLDVNGNAINGSLQLEIGTLLDRFGSEYGSYVSAASAPFSQRALPPSSLDTDPNNPNFPYGYHLYRVVRPFTVVGGPIAPWFGQPGLGAQFYTGGVGNIMKLLADGLIVHEDPSVLVTRSQGPCT
ncbi:hypothetical protein NQ176_g7344 [Zarea fungicola]|uniref:Uncharacterized protein n=1 Tax=Zarea fungicola TaxID=93591 RepID=A0ACC1N0G5_9HYPO|nr:hypothetical protein NQ176_g7344 [Lecanicillium fungicola]